MAIIRHCYYEYKIPILEWNDREINEMFDFLDTYIEFDKVRHPIENKEPDLDDLE